MLFSCLVDADYIDTERFYDAVEGRKRNRGWPKGILQALAGDLDQHLAEVEQKVRAFGLTEVNRIRSNILAAARQAASERAGIFTLTVPTGGGKTLSSLAFALEHAIQRELDRVIYVIPFTSIIEQTAEVFRGAFSKEHADTVVEHHSAFSGSRSLRPCAGWAMASAAPRRATS